MNPFLKKYPDTGPSPGVIEADLKGNKYEFQQMLGRGSFGSTWRAKMNASKTVAIKVYNATFTQAKKDLKEEIVALKQISSVCRDYAVCYIGYYAIKNKPRMVMDYIPGYNFIELYKREPLGIREKNNDIIVHLLCGLNKLHERGITHQDIKEENIMWDTDRKKPIYIDWGLACLQAYCDSSWCRYPCGMSGTTYTTPPEIKTTGSNEQNYAQTIAHDMWSIGVVLYDYYTFKHGTSINIYYDDINGDLRLANLNPKTALRYKSKLELDAMIKNNVNNSLARRVLPLLLETDWKRRLKNRPVILEFTGCSMYTKEEPGRGGKEENVIAGPIRAWDEKQRVDRSRRIKERAKELEKRTAKELEKRTAKELEKREAEEWAREAKELEKREAEEWAKELEKSMELAPIGKTLNCVQNIPPHVSPDDLIIDKKSSTENYCFLITELLVRGDYNPRTQTFYNPYTDMWVKLTADQQGLMQKHLAELEAIQQERLADLLAEPMEI